MGAPGFDQDASGCSDGPDNGQADEDPGEDQGEASTHIPGQACPDSTHNDGWADPSGCLDEPEDGQADEDPGEDSGPPGGPGPLMLNDGTIRTAGGIREDPETLPVVDCMEGEGGGFEGLVRAPRWEPRGLREEWQVREDLLRRWDLCRNELESRGDGIRWRRILRCIEEAQAVERECPRCFLRRIILHGKCKDRICPLCRNRYPSKKAKEILALLGHELWCSHYVATMGPEEGERVTPSDTTLLLKRTCKAVERCFRPVLPAGIAALHWCGDKAPLQRHVHVHLLWSDRGMHRGKLVGMPGPTISDSLRERLREETGEALGMPEGRRQGDYSFRPTPPQVGHCVRYLVRPQGCGNDVACCRWTHRGERLLRPFGMLATGRRKAWTSLLLADGWFDSEPEDHDEVDPVTGYRCPCTYHRKDVR